MKQIIYQGNNKKYIMLTFDYLTDSDWDETKNEDRILLNNILVHNVSTTDLNVDYIMNNLYVHHIETKETRIDEELYYLHTDVLIIDNLDDRTIRTIMDILNRNRNMYLCQGDIIHTEYFNSQHEMLTPYFLAYVARCNIGSTNQALLLPTNSTRKNTKYTEWFDYYITSRPVHGQKAIGYTTDSNLDINSWYNYLNPYGNKPKLNIIISIYDNYAEAINDTEGTWLLVYGLHIKTPDYYINDPRIKIHAELYNNTLIVMDNIKGYTSIKDTLLQSEHIFRNLDVITVNQYNLKSYSNDLIAYNSSRGYNSYRWMKLLLVNKNKIQGMKFDRNGYDGCYNIKVDYHFNGIKKISLYTKISKNRQGLNGTSSYIIPFEIDKNIHNQSISLLNRYLEVDNRDLQNEIVQEYISSCLVNDVNEEGDILVKWFKRATLNASTDEEKLKNAYTKLKDNLIEEYRNVKIYMEATKLTDKQPIPSVRLDKTLSTNPSKIISFNWTNHRLQNVEYYRLETPIDYTTLDVNYYYRKGRGQQAMIYNGKCECKNLIDKTKNELYLNLDNIIKIDLENRKRGR